MEPRASVLLLLLLLSAALCTADVPVDCCLSVLDKRVSSKAVVKVLVQEEGHGCAIRATVAYVKGGQQLCLPHPEEQQWVQRLVKAVSQRKARQLK